MSAYETTGQSDEWYTPKYVFDALDVHFDCDVAAPFDRDKIHTPCYYAISKGSLEQEWEGFVWMNPPFGKRNGIVPWLDKIASHGNGIALTPDRTSTEWWQKAAKQADAHLQVESKIKFIRSDGTTGDQPGTGTTLFAYGEKGVIALLNAEANGLGMVFTRLRSYQYKLL